MTFSNFRLVLGVTALCAACLALWYLVATPSTVPDVQGDAVATPQLPADHPLAALPSTVPNADAGAVVDPPRVVPRPVKDVAPYSNPAPSQRLTPRNPQADQQAWRDHLESTFASEAIDPERTSEATTLLREALVNDPEAPTVLVQQSECRSGSCRVTLSAANAEELTHYLSGLGLRVGPGLSSISAGPIERTEQWATVSIYLSPQQPSSAKPRS